MKLVDMIFCDEVRFELRKKISLMGVYGDRIQFQFKEEPTVWPIPLRLALMLRFQKESLDQSPDRFEFEYNLNNKKIIDVKGAIVSDPNQFLVNIIINAEGLPVELGELGFTIRILHGEKLVHALNIPSAIRIEKELLSTLKIAH